MRKGLNEQIIRLRMNRETVQSTTRTEYNKGKVFIVQGEEIGGVGMESRDWIEYIQEEQGKYTYMVMFK